MSGLIFVTGGARSGKSRFAEERATSFGAPVTYLATMEAGDSELVARVERHRSRRPAGWQTVEAPLEVAGGLSECPGDDTVLLDCLSLWVSNRLFSGGDPAAWEVPAWEAFIDRCVAAAREVLAVQAARSGALIVVSNETGMGIVPGDALSRWYRDALGLVNQEFARAAGEAYLLVSGLPVRLA